MLRIPRPAIHLELSIPRLLGDTKQQSEQRSAEAKDAMRRLFQYATIICGSEEAARRIWAGIAKRPRGAPKGSRRPHRDRQLLELYDKGSKVADQKELARWPRRIGLLCDTCERGQWGASAEAVTKHVRRLVRKRDRDRLEQSRTRTQATFGDPKSRLPMSSFIGAETLQLVDIASENTQGHETHSR